MDFPRAIGYSAILPQEPAGKGTGKPVLILHGDQDNTVPLGQSEELKCRCRETGMPCELHVIEGAGHGGPQFSAPERYALVKKFLDRNIKQLPEK